MTTWRRVDAHNAFGRRFEASDNLDQRALAAPAWAKQARESSRAEAVRKLLQRDHLCWRSPPDLGHAVDNNVHASSLAAKPISKDTAWAPVVLSQGASKFTTANEADSKRMRGNPFGGTSSGARILEPPPHPAVRNRLEGGLDVRLSQTFGENSWCSGSVPSWSWLPQQTRNMFVTQIDHVRLRGSRDCHGGFQGDRLFVAKELAISGAHVIGVAR
jgi:hypothetical protein